MIHNEYQAQDEGRRARPLTIQEGTICLTTLTRWHPLRWLPLWLAASASIMILLRY